MTGSSNEFIFEVKDEVIFIEKIKTKGGVYEHCKEKPSTRDVRSLAKSV